jgi:hypothetical protein
MIIVSLCFSQKGIQMMIETNTIIAIIAICKKLHFCDNREAFIAIIAIWSLIQGSKDHPGARLEA